MLEGRPAVFVHRPTKRGFDSICTNCAATVGWNSTEAELEQLEKSHVCVSTLERFKESVRP
jgi:hypothetical protein